MLLAVALAVMTVVVVATVVAPLMKGVRGAPERAAFDRAVYRDQLRELERDRARGLIDGRDAETARLEIERRLLAADTGAEGTPPPRAAGSPALAIGLALALPLAAVLLYLALGAPGVPDEPYAARGPERALAAANGRLDLDKTVAALEEKLKADPNRAEDWLLLGRSQAALGQWQKSAEAYQQALRLTKGRPDIAAAYGEMLVLAADGIVTPRAQEAFTVAEGRDPKNEVARFYLALADAQAGNAESAIAAWQKLAAEEPADSPLRAEIRTRIAAAARAAGLPVPALAAPAPATGPSAADMANAAKMSPEARQQMIRGMVERLAAKLKAEPNDLDGWTRLGRAYAVLGERDKAVDAYEQAAQLKPDDIAVLLGEAEALMPDRRPETPVPKRALALLHRVEALDPKQPSALWYLGLAAAQQRRFDEAKEYWQRLLAVMPADSEQRQAVAAAIGALERK